MSHRPRHVVFAFYGIGRLVYHFSTLRQLVETGHQVTAVFCRGRQPPPHSPEHEEAYEELDRLAARHTNLRLFFEGKIRSDGLTHGFIRTLGPKETRGETTSLEQELYLLRSYGAYLRRLPEDSFYVRRWHGFLTERLQKLVDLPLARRLLRQRVTDRILAAIEDGMPADPCVTAWLKEVRADVVVATPCNTKHSVEAEFIRAARKLHIPTAVPVLSWDNLTTKGLVPYHPTLVLAWNSAHAREARTIHGIPARNVVVTGSPFFDRWFDSRHLLKSREAFAAERGLDPAAPLLLYLGSSRNIAENEGWLVERLHAALRAHPRLKDTGLLVRPHPSNPAMCEQLAGLDGVTILSSKVPFNEVTTSAFYNTLSHSFAVVGINTSGLVDAVALDRPAFSVRTDRYRETHLEALHFQHLAESGAIEVAEDVRDLAGRLASVLEGSDARRGRRHDFITTFLRPRGTARPAGQVAAEAIILLAQGHGPGDVNQMLSLRGLELVR